MTAGTVASQIVGRVIMVHLRTAVTCFVGMTAGTIKSRIGRAVDAGVAGGAVAAKCWLSVMVLCDDWLCADHRGVAGFAIGVREQDNSCVVIARVAVKTAVETIRVCSPCIMVRIVGAVPLAGMAVAAGKAASDRRMTGVAGEIIGAGELMVRLS